MHVLVVDGFLYKIPARDRSITHEARPVCIATGVAVAASISTTARIVSSSCCFQASALVAPGLPPVAYFRYQSSRLDVLEGLAETGAPARQFRQFRTQSVVLDDMITM